MRTITSTSHSQTQRGITGLETAIILIAFVVVAAIFAFTVLSTGIFSAERSRETVHAGLEETRSTLEPKGGLIAIRGDVGGTDAVAQVKFVISTTVSGEAIDLTPPYTYNGAGTDPDASGLASKTVIAYIDSVQHIAETQWTVEFLGYSNGDYLLDKDEQAEITVWLHPKNTGTGAFDLGTAGSQFLTTRLGVNARFSIEIVPERGASFTLERRVPPRLNSVMDLR